MGAFTSFTPPGTPKYLSHKPLPGTAVASIDGALTEPELEVDLVLGMLSSTVGDACTATVTDSAVSDGPPVSVWPTTDSASGTSGELGNEDRLISD